MPGWRSTILVIGMLALAFQGSRGLWEPDEGFYGTAAAEMYDSGSWLVPTLEGRPFLDKPPLIYWGSILGMHLVGRNEWGLRLFHAIAFLLTALALGAIGATLWDPATGRIAALVYATTLGPFLASNVLTPDMLLAAAVAGFYLGYVRAEAATESRPRLRGWLLAGVAAGLGLLAKGPALLLFAAPILLHLALRRRLLPVLRQPGPWLGGAIALALGVTWYLWISRALPGAGSYILDNQIVGRIATSTYHRNAGTFGGVRVYLPTLIALMVPWGPIAWVEYFRGRKVTTAIRSSSLAPGSGRFDPAISLLWLWILLPLAILVIARSRLPLYALPLGGAIALATARCLARDAASLRAFAGWRWRAAFVAASLALLGVKAAVAYRPQERDSRDFARQVVETAGPTPCEVVSVDARRQALAFYLKAETEQVHGFRPDYPYFSKLEELEEEIVEARACPRRTVFIFQRQYLDRAYARLEAAELSCSERAEGTRRHAIVICESPAAQAEARGGDSRVSRDG